MSLPDFFVVRLVHQSDRVIWRGFCCCAKHAAGRAWIASPRCIGSELFVLPVHPEHPQRRAAAS